MRITREKPCQRRHHRLNAPLYVSIDGDEPSLAYDWSLGGLRIDNYQGKTLSILDEVSLLLELPFQGFQISFEVTGAIVRLSQDSHTLFIEFIDLSERSFDLMNHFVDDLIRGKMATIDDTICRIDVPVTPISTSPTPNPTEQMPGNRWPIKSIVMTFFYLSLGGFVFSYLALIIYSSYFTMEIETSVISSKIQTLKMPIDGVLKPMNLTIGAKFTQGQPLFSVENINLKNKINASKLKIKSAEIKLTEAKEKYRIESERMKLYQIVSTTDVKILKAQLAAKKSELGAADEDFIRLNKLKLTSLISTKQLEDAIQNQNTKSYQVKALEAKLVQATAMEAVSERRHYNHKEFGVDLDIKAVELQTLYSTLQVEQQRLAGFITAQNNQVVRAPYNGKVTSLFYSENTSVPRNEAILTFEEVGNNQVIAFLNQEEVLQVGLNDLANVFIPALGLELEALITEIDRSSGYLDKKNANYSWRDKKEKTARVLLQLIGTSENISLINAGLPAVVIFNRRSTNPLFSKIKNNNSHKVMEGDLSKSKNVDKSQLYKNKTSDKSKRAAYDSI